MKTKNFKLKLNKVTISNLKNKEMIVTRGGMTVRATCGETQYCGTVIRCTLICVCTDFCPNTDSCP